MLAVLKPLLTTFNYLRIEHSVKSWYDWKLPVIFTIVGFVLANNVPLAFFSFEVYGNLISELTVLLAGLGIAALAAVASFPKPSLDEKFDGEPAILRKKINGTKDVETVLTRRQFLSYLFGFVSSASIILYFFTPAVLGIVNIHVSPESGLLLPIATIAIELFYTVLSLQVVFALLLGLHYLADRIHR